MLSDTASVAGVKGISKVITAANNPIYQFRWGGYHEIFVASSLKKASHNIAEFRAPVKKSGNLTPTDIDIVTTRLNPTTGQTDKFFIQAKATVPAYAAGKSGLFASDSKEWLKAAMTTSATWNKKVEKLNAQAFRAWIHSDGNNVPSKLAEFIRKLDLSGSDRTLVNRIDWPGL